jgi:hypothetical protein
MSVMSGPGEASRAETNTPVEYTGASVPSPSPTSRLAPVAFPIPNSRTHHLLLSPPPSDQIKAEHQLLLLGFGETIGPADPKG